MAKLDTYAMTGFVAEQIKRLAGFGGVANVALEGPVADGATTDHTTFNAAAAQSNFIFVPPGSYNFTSSPVQNNKTYFGMDANVSGSYEGSDLAAMNVSGLWVNSKLQSSDTQHTMFVDAVVDVTNAPNGFQKNAFFAHITLREASDYVNGYSKDAVAIEGFAYTANNIQTGRIYGIHSRAWIRPGTDGLLYSYEAEVINDGTDQSSVGTTTSKYGIQITCAGSANVTAGIIIENGSGSTKWHTGIFIVEDALVASTSNAIRVSSKYYVTNAGRVGVGARPLSTSDHYYSYETSGNNRMLMENTSGSPFITFKRTGAAAYSVGVEGTSTNFRIGVGESLVGTVHVAMDANAIQLFSSTISRGGGVGVLAVANAGTVPASNPTGGGVLYAEGGALKWRGSSGTVTTIANA